MPPWSNWQEGYNWIITSYNGVFSACEQIQWYYDQAQTALTASQYKVAIQYLINARSHIINALQWNTTYKAGESPSYAVSYCLDWLYDNIGPAEITMAAILNAMLIASPYEVNYFVGLVDAYRQSIWNKPFNKEFYAALARGFMEWE